jgi:voltage-gated potassium channel
VAGDTSTDDVFKRACVQDAKTIGVSGHTDQRAIEVCIALDSYLHHHPRNTACVVVYIEDESKASFIRKINPHFECVTSLRTFLIAQALKNPGSARIIHDLVDLGVESTSYRIEIPEGFQDMTFERLFYLMHRKHGAILLGYAEGKNSASVSHLNPDPLTMIGPGMGLFYVAKGRIDKVVDWSALGK